MIRKVVEEERGKIKEWNKEDKMGQIGDTLGKCQRANSELELSQLLFISIRQRELVRVLTSLVSSTYTYSTWSVHLFPILPTKLCVTYLVT